MHTENAHAQWLPFAMYPALKAFLEKNGLRWEGNPDRCLVMKDDEGILASCALMGDVVKYVCVDASLRQTGWATKLVSMMIEDAFLNGKTHLFLFTGSDKTASFEEIAFRKIAQYESVALLECGMKSVNAYANTLKKYIHPGTNGAIVMNANPFTLGHRYLIEQASKKVDRLHVFMVREDKSAFPASVRYRLVSEGCKDLENVVVHRGSEYVLSHATFPSYFIKDASAVSALQAGLDVNLFARHIAPALDIRKRFVGSEPFDPATNSYNRKMKEILTPLGIEVIEIERLTGDENAISASRVRKYLVSDEKEKAYALLTETTKAFLETDEGKEIIERMKQYENH
ncbi:MAG: [Clostridia bacterium]|nr:[citrate (pro-3S)-lyase] ligase [Clostridia bacterium]